MILHLSSTTPRSILTSGTSLDSDYTMTTAMSFATNPTNESAIEPGAEVEMDDLGATRTTSRNLWDASN